MSSARRREFSLSFLQPDSVRGLIRTITTHCAGAEGTSLWPAIQRLQSTDLPVTGARRVEVVWYEGAADVFAPALGSLMGGTDAGQVASTYAAHERPALMAASEGALQLFEARFPATFAVFNETIRFLVFSRRPGYSGGTVSNRIGLIWLSPETSWTAEDWVENLIHEFVHNLLFMEDMVNGLLVAGGDRLEEPDAMATSAIRQVKRGYDKSYHSAFVSLVIIEIYRTLDRPDKIDALLGPLLVCLADLLDKRQFAAPRGQELLFELIDRTVPLYPAGRLAV